MSGNLLSKLPRGIRFLGEENVITNFATVSWCNAKCVFCSYPAAKERKEVALREGQGAIDALRDLGVSIVSLTGGEPFLNPHLTDLAEYANQRGLIVFTGTNGTMLDQGAASRLARAGVQAVWISYEGPDAKTFDANRGVRGLTEKIRLGLRHLRQAGVNFYCICVINKTIQDYGAFMEHLAELGYDKVKFDYPMTHLQSSYLGFSEWPMLQFTGEEMEQVIGQILDLKKEGHAGVEVLNPTQGLVAAGRFWSGEPAMYPCYAGEKVLYLDWNLDLWRCTTLPEKFGKVWDVKPHHLKRIDCNLCYYQGVRDYDSLYYLITSAERGRDAFASGHAFEAARSLLDPHNLAGLQSAIELGTSGFA
ncbi:MAG: radical SAM protein [Thermoplasmata archaeon]